MDRETLEEAVFPALGAVAFVALAYAATWLLFTQ